MFLNNVWLLLAAKLLLPVAIAVYVNAPPIVPGAYVAEFADDTVWFPSFYKHYNVHFSFMTVRYRM